MAKNSKVEGGIGQAIDQAAKNGTPISKDQMREWLRKDIVGVHVLLVEILNTQQCIDALTEVFWERLKQKQAAAAPAPGQESLFPQK